MEISDSQLERFRELCAKSSGKKPSKKEALVQANQFLELLALVYRPITKEEVKKVNKNSI